MLLCILERRYLDAASPSERERLSGAVVESSGVISRLSRSGLVAWGMWGLLLAGSCCLLRDCWDASLSQNAMLELRELVLKPTPGRLIENGDRLLASANAALAVRPYDESIARDRVLLMKRLAERESRQVAEQEQLLAATAGSEALQQQADTLLSQRQPSRQCIDEAQALYRRARKLRRAVGAITPRLELHRQQLGAIEASLTYLEQAESLDQLEAIREELEELLGRSSRQARRQRRATAAAEGKPAPLELHTRAGVPLQVGRNHRQNEWIAFRQARRGDLWFHAQELPGSHVVLKRSTMPTDEADLQCAADLAAHFSRGRANGRVPVVMVPVDELQRIPGAAPGTVRHRGGTVLWGVPERALSLLAAQQP